jgi:hypothetical protein
MIYPLSENGLMLKGAYKNDLKNRLFFKRLIGEYFHFTAFGIDWLNEQWLKGTPPTYLDFARMWKSEYEKRQAISASPKEEWAYINFVQSILRNNSAIRQENLNKLWKEERERLVLKVCELLREQIPFFCEKHQGR